MKEEEVKEKHQIYHDSFKYRMITNIIAGGISSLGVDLLFFPMETIKTRLQTSQKFLKIETFKNLYKGVGIQPIISVPGASIYFVGYEATKYIFDHNLISNNFSIYQKSFFGGISAETLRVILINPFEIVKQQMQVGQHHKFINACKYIKLNFGLAGFYRGFWSLLGREIPFSCLQMPVYEVLPFIY